MSLITIEQLLESVDLDFEPRWVTKDESGWIKFFSDTPRKFRDQWICDYEVKVQSIYPIKISDFANKKWQDCIYEVPRKTDEYEQNLEKLRPTDSDLVYRVRLPRKTTGNEIEQKMLAELERKLNAIVDAAIDAVNELKGAKNE